MLTRSQRETLEIVESSDIQFVRLAFCDICGVQKNISIQATELQDAFENGIAFDASSIAGFRDVSHSDLLLFPDSTTLALLPWRPSRGGVARFFCEIRTPDGAAFEADCRRYLAETEELLKQYDLCCLFGTECEFYLFKCDENGTPTSTPLDRGSYFDIAPLDCGENVRREICQTLATMGIHPERSHHEQGPGQNEIDFRYSTALNAADNVITFKQIVSTVAARNGLHACFLPKPIENEPGNGFHIHSSIHKADMSPIEDEKITHHFMAGVLQHTPEMTAVLNALESSYERLGRNKAPDRVSWSRCNRSQMIRLPAANPQHKRMELRSPDASVNPYLAFALVMRAGLDGILNKIQLPPACDENLLTVSEEIRSRYPKLPSSLDEAKQVMQNSEFMKRSMPEHIFNHFNR